MIRLTALWLFVAFLCLYAFRNWFHALCGLVLLTLLSQHPDMPGAVFDIPGLNPWNLVFFAVIAGCCTDRRPPIRNLPPAFTYLLVAYIAVLVIGGGRALIDYKLLIARWGFQDLQNGLMDLLINPLKYVIVGLLFYRGCRTEKDLRLGVHTLLLFGLLHAVMMYKSMKGMVLAGDYEDARRMTDKLIGLHANDLAGLLTFAGWSFVVYATVLKGRARWLAGMAAAIMLPAIVGCHSRTAYAANIGIALVLGAVRWRKLLVALPFVGAAIVGVFPQIIERATMDVKVEEVSGDSATDLNELTAGRTYNIWDPTIHQIVQSPLIGYGRYALRRTPAYFVIRERENIVPTHPHNSYLELLVDSGVLGLGVALGLFGYVGVVSLRMLQRVRRSFFTVIGGLGLTAVTCSMILAIGGGFFYPRESLLWLICSFALVARAWAFYRTLPRPAAGQARIGPGVHRSPKYRAMAMARRI